MIMGDGSIGSDEHGQNWFTMAPASFTSTPAEYLFYQLVLRGAIFMGEIFTTALLSSSLILVGLVLGFALLKIQGGEE
jgi:cytochrome b6-f complex subunit 7